MYLHRVVSVCGRTIPKPKDDVEEEDFDEVAPMQDQIENLRVKITLKEQYNRVLLENFEDSREGTSHALRDMTDENKLIREHLVDVLRNEENAVHKALRAYRRFQLAMLGRKEEPCIIWLEDKIFDAKKRANCLLDKLIKERKVFQNSEFLVSMIEKWPRPGSLPWETAALMEFERLENLIEDIKMKGETSWILNQKYKSIRSTLMDEQGKYLPALDAYEHLLGNLKTEWKELEKMLDDAIYLKDESYSNLLLTEQEAKENRKARRKLTNKMKKAVDAILAENQRRAPGAGKPKRREFDMLRQSADENKGPDINELMDEIDRKSEILAQYRDRARKLVTVMAVEDLNRIPVRYKSVIDLGDKLQVELDAKEEFRDLLVKQRDQLLLLLCQFRYTGHQKEVEYEERLAAMESSVDLTVNDRSEALKRLSRLGDVTVDLRLYSVAILAKLTEWKKSYPAVLREGRSDGNLKHHLKKIFRKVRKLMRTVNEYEEMFKNKPKIRNYDYFVHYETPKRLIRVGSPVISTDDEDGYDDDMSNAGVPTREDIKAKSQRFIQLGMIKRGGIR